jgi:hypothetical protein
MYKCVFVCVYRCICADVSMYLPNECVSRLYTNTDTDAHADSVVLAAAPAPAPSIVAFVVANVAAVVFVVDDGVQAIYHTLLMSGQVQPMKIKESKSKIPEVYKAAILDSMTRHGVDWSVIDGEVESVFKSMHSVDRRRAVSSEVRMCMYLVTNSLRTARTL